MNTKNSNDNIDNNRNENSKNIMTLVNNDYDNNMYSSVLVFINIWYPCSILSLFVALYMKHNCSWYY